MTLQAQDPITDHFLPACSTLPAFMEHKLWRTEGIQDKFIKHHVKLFLVPVSPGDPRLGSKKNRTEQRRGSKHQLTTDICKVKEIFLFKRETAEEELFDPCCLRDSREGRYFLWSLLSIPYAAWLTHSQHKPSSNNTLPPTTEMLQALCTVVSNIQLPFDYFQACDI